MEQARSGFLMTVYWAGRFGVIMIVYATFYFLVSKNNIKKKLASVLTFITEEQSNVQTQIIILI